MWAYPRVHVDTGVLCFTLPRKEFYRHLRRIVEAGFGTRIMFGSDQMNWPGRFDGLDTFEDLPQDGRCVADYGF
jgi:hypothetical protein